MQRFAKSVRAFAADRSGAMTIDWVALTAAVVVTGLGLVYPAFGALLMGG